MSSQNASPGEMSRGDWAYEVIDGGAQTLLLLHGGGLNLRAWDLVIRALPGYRTIVVDLPMHGHTTVDNWDWAAVVNDLARILQDCDAHQPLVVGHSVGGWTALALAQAVPVAGVVSLDGWVGHPWPTREIPSAPPVELTVHSDADALVSQLVDQTSAEGLDPDFVRSVGERAVATVGDDRFRMRPFPEEFISHLPVITGFPSGSVLQALDAPVTVVLADEPGHDDEAAARQGERQLLVEWLETHAPDTVVEWVAGDHNFPLTRPDVTADLIRRALDRVLATRVGTSE